MEESKPDAAAEQVEERKGPVVVNPEELAAYKRQLEDRYRRPYVDLNWLRRQNHRIPEANPVWEWTWAIVALILFVMAVVR